MNDIQQQIIPFEYRGQRIDAVLAKLFPDFSRAQLTSWIKSEKIKVNDKYLKPKDKVLGGEQVELSVSYENKVSLAQPESIPLDIVFEDEQFLIINKPAGLVVHPGAGNANHTLVNALLYHHPFLENLPRAGIIHRLDKHTTGLLVVAKTLKSHTELTRQMQEREIKRNYITLVQGHLISGGEINTLYGRHPGNRIKMAVCKQGKQAITYYFINKQYHCLTLLNVELLTGRTHQIRVHMDHIKHPVVGDPVYGGRIRLPEKASYSLINCLQQFKRQALHAASLSLIHPVKNTVLTFHAPLPEDFQNLLRELDTYYESLES